MNTVAQLSERIDAFVAKRLSVPELEDWFFHALWDVEESSNELAKRRFRHIEGLLAEASHAHWTCESLRQELARANPHAQSARRPPTIARPIHNIVDGRARTGSANRALSIRVS